MDSFNLMEFIGVVTNSTLSYLMNNNQSIGVQRTLESRKQTTRWLIGGAAITFSVMSVITYRQFIKTKRRMQSIGNQEEVEFTPLEFSDRIIRLGIMVGGLIYSTKLLLYGIQHLTVLNDIKSQCPGRLEKHINVIF